MSVTTKPDINPETMNSISLITVTKETQGWMLKAMVALRAIDRESTLPWIDEYETLYKMIVSAHKGMLSVEKGAIGPVTKEKPE